MLRGKKILLGVTGGIAAYKIPQLIRLLKKNEAEVQVIATTSAFQFVTPTVLSTLSHKPALSSFTQNAETGVWNNHVSLALWADLFLVAPLTANTLAKMASGLCDNLLLATYFSAKCPVIVAPAMDLDMYAHDTVTQNLQKLANNGVQILPANEGELASGLEGKGRMQEPEEIFQAVWKFFTPKTSYHQKHFLITAGPTHEPIDPVRFIGNRSSGKMGFALAEAALKFGAKVTLVSGPTQLQINHPSLELIRVETAQQMFDASIKAFKKADVGIFAAAVSDYRVKQASDKKIKKQQHFSLDLEKNPDILQYCGQNKNRNQMVIGFALETHDEEKYAQEKLKAKNADFIILNSTQTPNATFGFNTNKVTVFGTNNKKEAFELMSKQILAEKLLQYFYQFIV